MLHRRVSYNGASVARNAPPVVFSVAPDLLCAIMHLLRTTFLVLLFLSGVWREALFGQNFPPFARNVASRLFVKSCLNVARAFFFKFLPLLPLETEFYELGSF